MKWFVLQETYNSQTPSSTNSKSTRGGKFEVSYQDANALERDLKKVIDDKKYNVYFPNAIAMFTGLG